MSKFCSDTQLLPRASGSCDTKPPNRNPPRGDRSGRRVDGRVFPAHTTLLLPGKALGQTDERPYAHGGRSLAGEAVRCGGALGRARDVEVRPGDARRVVLVAGAADELLQEHSGEQRAAGRVARV